MIRIVRKQAKGDGGACGVTARKAKAGDAHVGDVAGDGPRALDDTFKYRADTQGSPNEGSAPKDGGTVLKNTVYS